MELVKYENNELVIANDIVNQLQEFERQKVKMELIQKQIKEDLKEAMEKYNITSFETSNKEIKATYKKVTTRTTIDSKRLKEELPDVAKEYSKTSEVKSSISLKIEC